MPRIHGPVDLYFRLGILRMAKALAECQRLAKERSDLAKRVAQGEKVQAMGMNGDLLEFNNA